MPEELRTDAGSPVAEEDRPPGEREPEAGTALALSGGGYRAMLFHVGSLWRLNEAGLLGGLQRISCVSGGSITGAYLGLRWRDLGFAGGRSDRFAATIADPIRKLASTTIDWKAIVLGALLPGRVWKRVAKAYREVLFGDATLQDLPADPPRIVLNATSVQSGALCRFMRPALRDWKVGAVLAPRVPLATAVAASSAFPPALSPVELEFAPGDFVAEPSVLTDPAYRRKLVLTDGGVYDNLGLETVWKRYRTVFVSDGGGQLQPETGPASNWIEHALRVNGLIDNQVRSLRKRQVVGSFVRGERTGAYWSIRSDYASYERRAPGLDCPVARTIRLADTATRLRALEPLQQERIVNWGYAATDAALRTFFQRDLPQPAGFPYPASGV